MQDESFNVVLESGCTVVPNSTEENVPEGSIPVNCEAVKAVQQALFAIGETLEKNHGEQQKSLDGINERLTTLEAQVQELLHKTGKSSELTETRSQHELEAVDVENSVASSVQQSPSGCGPQLLRPKRGLRTIAPGMDGALP